MGLRWVCGGLLAGVDGVVCRCVGLEVEGGFLAEGFMSVGSGPLEVSGVARSCWASSEEMVSVMMPIT